jgi:hypothetical protein
MKGDFSRLTFRPGKRYTSVRLQQARVTLDSDWNEHTAIREYLERIRFEDVVGTSAVPCSAGFAVTHDRNGSLALSAGRIYVGGFSCELDERTPLKNLLRNPLVPASDRSDLLYVDAWERHLTAVDDPELLDVALGGADTTTRLKVAWRIGVIEDVDRASCDEASSLLPPQPNGLMSVAAPGGYRGTENQLYRVEIHDGGSLGSASFKWSRDNGSVVFAITEFLCPDSVRLAPRHDPACALDSGDWVEVSGDQVEQAGAVGTLARVADIRDDGSVVVLDRDVSRHRGEGHPRIRRWNQRSGATVPVSADWVELEAGIQVRFSGDEFRSGDYWAVPARPATESIDWPDDQAPYGIEHRLCPLALVTWAQVENGWTPMIQDCRRAFLSLTDIHEEITRLQLEIAELRNNLARQG